MSCGHQGEGRVSDGGCRACGRPGWAGASFLTQVQGLGDACRATGLVANQDPGRTRDLSLPRASRKTSTEVLGRVHAEQIQNFVPVDGVMEGPGALKPRGRGRRGRGGQTLTPPLPPPRGPSLQPRPPLTHLYSLPSRTRTLGPKAAYVGTSIRRAGRGRSQDPGHGGPAAHLPR